MLSTGKKVFPTHVESLLGCVAAGGTRLPCLAKGCRGWWHLWSRQLRRRRPAPRSLAAEIERRLSTAASEEQIHDFAILERPFSIERGELTPKLSLCRPTIAKNFSAELAGRGLSSGPNTGASRASWPTR